MLVSNRNRDSVYAIVMNTEAGERHISNTAIAEFCLSLSTLRPILHGHTVPAARCVASQDSKSPCIHLPRN
jgi:hypothetical protein